MAQEANYSIVQGPSKWDLMLGLFDNTAKKTRPISFEISSAGPSFHTVEIVLNSVEREDGSGESWNFSGFVLSGPVLPIPLGTKQGSVHLSERPNGKNVRGHFSTRDRRGYLVIK